MPNTLLPRSSLDDVATRDRGRLIGRWQRLHAAGAQADAAQVVKLQAEIDASRARVEARRARIPAIRIDESLPIAARSEEIIRLIGAHQVLVLAGETGSGKTTQLPKLCLAAGRGAAGMIGCTQPRRIAARTVARRASSELGTSVGDLVGFQVRFDERIGDASLVKFMTDGILLAETQGDAWLSAYDTIILDEAHERSLNIDFLLGYLKRLLARRRDLKLIVTSATIDTARFAGHFDNAPVVEVEGRSHPVEVRWRPPVENGDANTVDQVVAAMDEISSADPLGDVLVFLPGEREIRDAHLALGRRKYRETEVLALYARLSANEQDRVFKPGPKRRIVLATNVAETSRTVPRIRYVIDSGTARVKRYSQRGQLERLHVEAISQAAADQRKGRCGRVGPGICYRLYAEDDFAQRARFTDPEILRTSLAGVILRMLSLKLGDVADFPFIEAPSERAIGDGYRRLIEIGAIDERHRLTRIGSEIANVPVDVSLARMLVEARRLGVLRELQVLVSFLSIQDPRERPAHVRAEADAAHARFADVKSDFNGILNLWAAYAEAHQEFTQSRLRDWCASNFLNFMRMREWRELHRQLVV
ncbi:MAG: ATP-dependent RNA helicase HrpA, partial [Dokdonella sp.]